MLDDILNEKIFCHYIPISYEEMFEWIKQEPLLIYKQIPPVYSSVTEDTIFCLLRTNILNYLKRFVYREIERWIRDCFN